MTRHERSMLRLRATALGVMIAMAMVMLTALILGCTSIQEAVTGHVVEHEDRYRAAIEDVGEVLDELEATGDTACAAVSTAYPAECEAYDAALAVARSAQQTAAAALDDMADGDLSLGAFMAALDDAGEALAALMDAVEDIRNH